MINNQIKVAGNSLDIINKLFDFLVINLTLISLLMLLDRSETVVDVAIGLLFSSLFMLVAEYTDMYKYRIGSHLSKVILGLVKNFALTIVIMEVFKIAIVRQLEGSEMSALTIGSSIIWYLIAFLVLTASRLLYHHFYLRDKPAVRVAILGLTQTGLYIQKAVKNQFGDLDVDFTCYDDRGTNRFGYIIKADYKGKMADLIQDARDGKLDQVYIALPMVARERIQLALRELSDTTVDTFVVPDLFTYSRHFSQIHMVDTIQTLSVFSSPFDGIGGWIKRGLDLVIGSAILLMITPVLAFVAIGVKMSSPGPVLFKQDRYGLGGKKIKVWKFRSMKVMENAEVVTQATKGDPRVTKFGAFIRRTSLDELPQFFNVIQGSMSIVGPRPHAVSHNEEYRVLVDNYMIRHKVKPGITGLAQIKGYRGETDTLDKMEKRIQYDIEYMKRWTPMYDLKIIFLTIFKGFVGDSAY